MAINWGAALGKAVETGISTYERLGEEELRAMQREKLRKDLEQEKALDALYAEKQAKIGKEVSTFTPDTKTPEPGYYPQGTEPKTALPAGRAGANYVSDSDGMTLKEDKSVYTERQALSDIAREAPIVGGRKGALEAMQYKSAAYQSRMEDDRQDFMEKTTNMTTKLQTMSETGNTPGFLKIAKEHGLDIKMTEGKNGSVSFSYTDKAGKKHEANSLGAAVQMTQEAYLMNAASGAQGMKLFGGPKEFFSYLQGERKLSIEEQATKDKGEYYQSEAAFNRARIGVLGQKPLKKEVSNSDIKAFITDFGDKPSNEKDPKTGKPIAIRDLPLSKQAAYASEFYLGKDVAPGGYDDKGTQGWDPKKTAPTASAIPVDKASVAQREVDARLNQVMRASKMLTNSPANYKEIADNPRLQKDVRARALELYKEFEEKQAGFGE